MAHIHIPERIPVRFLERSKTANLVFGAMAIVGAVAFFLSLQRDVTAAWASYVANWLFFASISMGAIIFAVATTIVKAKWNWSLRRISVSFAAFLPVAFLLLLPMLGLGEEYFPWIEMMADDPIVQAKAAYLNKPFLIVRTVVGVAILFSLGIYFAYLAVRPDMGLVDESQLDAGQASWRTRLMSGWAGQEQEEVRSWRRMSKLAPAMVLTYAVVMSFVIYDFAMSLDPHWFSTLFGGWFFMGAFWGGIALTAFTGLLLRRKDAEMERFVGLQQRHDIGKLAFGFTVFWTYLFFSQYIVIWYGKLPWEQTWMVARSGEAWGRYSLTVVILCFLIPFAGLIGRKAKMTPITLQLLTGVILFGLWNERYFLVAPSIVPSYESGAMLYHLLTGVGFLGLFMMSARWFLSTFPMLQIWQPVQAPEMVEVELASAERSS
ncbi:hypothetical protein [Gaopeijia maritima]|uniref:Quinol:cytochrome c oxidoreductase quinone-binding subunit 2 n=1 Tax=Gaopeijia maritima TaxID=3119007 RepID=A0ABU9E5V3_9BACT